MSETEPHPPSGATPCRRHPTRVRWESITWPGKSTAYPCAHDHAHCDFIGCVEHIDGMHVDALGDAIVHIGCDLCRCPRDGQSLRWHQFVGGTHYDGSPRTNGEFIGCPFGQEPPATKEQR